MFKIVSRVGFVGLALAVLAAVFVVPVGAQELVRDTQVTSLARVVEVLNQEQRRIPGTEVKGDYQTIKVLILDGEEKGKEVTVENDYLQLNKGDKFYLVHTVNTLEGRDYYSVSEPYRLPVVYAMIALFLLAVLLFGGVQGVRGLASLIGSFLLIYFVLFPSIMSGYSPVLVSLGVSSLIIILGSYITHGFTKTTTSAVIGMVLTILVTGAMAHFVVGWADLSGYSADEATYLHFNSRGSIDFVGLLLGGILIGLLGVLYDAAIGQAISVEELNRAGGDLSRRYIFKRAMRMGREHIGALVNTLAIAYVGASLPLLLLFYSSASSFTLSLNHEIFATEIIRTMIGSIGLILTVPVTSIVAVMLLVRKGNKRDSPSLETEKILLEHGGHGTHAGHHH